MSFKFYDILYKNYNILLEADKEGKNDYYLYFTFSEANKSKTSKIELILNLSKDDHKKFEDLGNIVDNRNIPVYGRNFYIRLKKDTDNIEKKMYSVSYKIKKPDIVFLYASDENYRYIVNEYKTKKISNDNFKIYPTTVDELIKIIKKEPVGRFISNRLKSVSEIKSTIDEISSTLGKQKGQKIVTKSQKELEKTKEDKYYNIALKSEEIFGKFSEKAKQEASKFFDSSTNSTILQNIIKYYILYKNQFYSKDSKLYIKSEKDLKEAISNKNKEIKNYVKKIKDFSSEKEVQEAIIKYYTYIKVNTQDTEYAPIVSSILSEYLGETETSVKDPSYSEKQTNKKPAKKQKSAKDLASTKDTEKSDEDKKWYVAYAFDDDENLIFDDVYLSDDQYNEVKKKAEINSKEYVKDKEEFDDWYKSTDPNKSEFPPKIKSPKSYGIVLIKEKPMNELSATGGGAAPGTGASVTPGSGEGVATKYAFAKKPKRYTFKNEAKDIFIETIKQHFKNK